MSIRINLYVKGFFGGGDWFVFPHSFYWCAILKQIILLCIAFSRLTYMSILSPRAPQKSPCRLRDLCGVTTWPSHIDDINSSRTMHVHVVTFLHWCADTHTQNIHKLSFSFLLSLSASHCVCVSRHRSLHRLTEGDQCHHFAVTVSSQDVMMLCNWNETGYL